jgi:hypothetical protein
MGSASASDRVGLCAACRHARIVRSARGSIFWQCGRAAADPGFPKYPRLPVEECNGFDAGAPSVRNPPDRT